HQRQLEGVGPGGAHRRAEQPARVAHREADQGGGRGGGGEDQIALVLPVLVIDDDHGGAGGDRRDRVLDGVQAQRAHRVCPVPGSRAAVSFSTYLASTSSSRFTRSPTARRPRVVRARDSGMRPIVTWSPSIAATVRLTPSTAREPLATRGPGGPAGRERRSSVVPPPSSRPTTSPTPATWAWTMWPSSRPSARTQRSRFTVSPAERPPREVAARVVEMTSALQCSPSTAVTVRQQPLTAIESPSAMPSRTCGERILRR